MSENHTALPGRRTILKFGACALLAAGAGLALPGTAPAARNNGRVLVLYFSHSGNTAQVARAFHAALGGDIVEVKAVRAYSQDYDTVVDEAKKEQEANARPELAMPVPDFAAYDTVFLGYPSWWGTMPMVYFTLLEKGAGALAGKTVVPFCTHEGSGLGRGPADIRKLAPGAKVASGFDMRGRSVSRAESRVGEWLKKQGYID
ncbi:MAG: flavodoxin [Desulfovibrionaceae bacterium]|nr:flavodoxin [Desulfovibrionaceae bacterium]